VAAEADQADRAEHDERERGALERSAPIARARRAEQHERQRQAGRDLHTDAGHERGRACAKARRGAGRQRQGARKREQDQRVVVRTAHGEHEQHGIEPDEGRRPAARLAEAPRGHRDERNGAEAREHGERLERPQPAGEAERHEGVADQREQRPVGGVLVGPAEEREDFVARGLRGDVGVGVESVQRAEPGEADVAEHVLGDQRRPEQEERVGRHHGRRDRAQAERARGQQHEQIARAHDQAERLKAARADAHAEPFQRPGQPADPAAAARGDVLRRFPRRAGRRQEGARDDAEQPEQPERPQQPAAAGSRLSARGGLTAACKRWRGPCRRAGRGRGDRHRPIVASSAQAGVGGGM
jgi:hypothetical protein